MTSARDFTFRPLPSQYRAMVTKGRAILAAGGYRSGKTVTLCNEGFRASEADAPCSILCIEPTYPMLSSVLFPTLVQWLPGAKRWPRAGDKASDALGPYVRDWSASERVMTWHNGVRWYMRSAESIPDGITAGTVLVDEPRLMRHEDWHVVFSRASDPRSKLLRVFLAGVPAAAWIQEEFDSGVKGRHVIRLKTTENIYLKPSPEEYAAGLNLSPRRARSYLYGEFSGFEGVVFEGYEPHAGSVIPVGVDPKRKTWGGLDFGGRRPAFVMIQQLDTRNAEGRSQYAIVEEVVSQDVLEAEHAQGIVRRCREHGAVLLNVYADPAGNARNAQTGMKSMQVYQGILKDAGVLSGAVRAGPNPGNPVERHVPNGIEVVQSLFLDDRGRRRLFVDEALAKRTYPAGSDDAPRLVGVDRALKGYKYPDKRPGSDEPVKDGVHDHVCLAGETPVLTPAGWRRMDTIQAGDAVVAFDRAAGQFSVEVVDAAGRTSVGATCLEVDIDTPDGRRSVIATPEHPFLCHTGEMRAVHDLSPGDSVVVCGIVPYQYAGAHDGTDDHRREAAGVRGGGLLAPAEGTVLPGLARGCESGPTPKIPASCGVGGGQRTDPAGQGMACASQGQEPGQQLPGQLGTARREGTRIGTHDAGAAGVGPGQHGKGHRRGSGVAPLGGGEGVASGNGRGVLEGQAAGGTDVSALRKAVRNAAPCPFEVLSPELQDGQLAPSSWPGPPCGQTSGEGSGRVLDLRGKLHDPAKVPGWGLFRPVPARGTVAGVRSAAPRDVYNLTVRGSHTFVANGVVVSNCDALRYWAVGMFGIAGSRDPDQPPSTYRQNLRDREIRSIEEEHRT